MSQTEVLEFLEQNKDYYSSQEIADKLNQSRITISANLLKLRKHKLVEYIAIKNKTNNMLFKYKII